MIQKLRNLHKTFFLFVIVIPCLAQETLDSLRDEVIQQGTRIVRIEAGAAIIGAILLGCGTIALALYHKVQSHSVVLATLDIKAKVFQRSLDNIEDILKQKARR